MRQLILCRPTSYCLNSENLLSTRRSVIKRPNNSARWKELGKSVLYDLRTTLRNCAVIGHILLQGITVRTPMRLFTLEIGVAQFRSVTKIAPKSSVLSVNKSLILDQSIQFDFRCGAKAIQCSVNGKPCLSKIPQHLTTHKAGFQ